MTKWRRKRGAYLAVWNEMMLSDPLRAVANAWSKPYLSDQHLSPNTFLPSWHPSDHTISRSMST